MRERDRERGRERKRERELVPIQQSDVTGLPCCCTAGPEHTHPHTHTHRERERERERETERERERDSGTSMPMLSVRRPQKTLDGVTDSLCNPHTHTHTHCWLPQSTVHSENIENLHFFSNFVTLQTYTKMV